jgi:predicted nucleic acid-binding protein
VVDLVDAFSVYEVTQAIVLEAARAARDHQMSYWDAQVWATAKLNQIPYVLSEDLQGWDRLEGVRFVNPFARGFELSSLGISR